MLRKDFIKYHFPVIFLCVLIFVLSSIPGQYYPEVDFKFSDKIVHFGIYFILALAFYMSLSNQNRYKQILNHPYIFAVVFTSAYGASDEVHQFFVPSRVCDFYDFLANTAGAITAMLILYLILWRRKEGKKEN